MRNYLIGAAVTIFVLYLIVSAFSKGANAGYKVAKEENQTT
jgi:hypothetical protein